MNHMRTALREEFIKGEQDFEQNAEGWVISGFFMQESKI